jgi:hypothetical protein
LHTTSNLAPAFSSPGSISGGEHKNASSPLQCH